jgi:hypothetical protein
MPESRACESFGTFVGILPYQPAESAAASGASLQSRSDRHRVATKRRPVIPSESGEASQSSGGTMIEGSSSADRERQKVGGRAIRGSLERWLKQSASNA